MSSSLLQRLLDKYITETLSGEERVQLMGMLGDEAYRKQLEQILDGEFIGGIYTGAEEEEKFALIYAGLVKRRQSELPVIPVHRVHFLRRSWRGIAAAAVLIGLSAGAYFFIHRVPSPPLAEIRAHTDVKPGKAGALLTLSDGRQVLLDSLQNGVVAMQGNAEVKIQNGRLVYNKTHNRHGEEATVYNTISTPRGRQFQLVLPEGTKVWLNAASSLKYPVAFTGGERKVEITGEAYFEVSRNAHLPFRVKVNDHTEVEVLGTFFNINAYGDEARIKTTLLEGAVKVSSGSRSQLLSPGQQAQVSKTDGSLALVRDADVNEAVAWKNGAFSFNNSSPEAVMRQIARWYDIEVEYRGALPTGSFSGEIDRSLTLDQVLKGLTKTRIHYRIEKENKLIILP